MMVIERWQEGPEASGRSEEIRARLLDAAGEEFARHGFEGATIRHIIARAGANIAAVNYHFGDKENLYVQAVIAAYQHCMEPLPELPDEPIAAAAELRGFIRHFLGRILAVDGGETWHHALSMRELAQPSRAIEVILDGYVRPRFARLASILQRLRPDLDPREQLAMLFSVVGQCLFYKLARPMAWRLAGEERFASLDLDFLTDHITRFTLAGLGVPSDAAGVSNRSNGSWET